MPRLVQGPDGRIHSFPDDATDDDISDALDSVVSADAKGEDKPSLGGFAANVVTSGGRAINDMLVQPALHPVETGKSVVAMAAHPVKTAQAVGTVLSNRYGSPEKAKETLYNDPVGAVTDFSTLLTGGATIAPKASKLAAAAKYTNPIMALKPVAKGVEYGAAAALRPFLDPPKVLRRQQRTALEIERTALTEGATRAGASNRKVKKATAQADRLAAAAPRRTPNAQIADMPKTLAATEKGLDHLNDLDRVAAVEAEVLSSLPTGGATTAELLEKRRYLDRVRDQAFRAADRGGVPTNMRQAAQGEVLDNIRAAIRQNAPGIADVDDKARRLGTVRSAFNEANLRPKGIPMSAALAGAGAGGWFGGPVGSAVGAAYGVSRTFPQIPATLLSAPVRGTAAVAKAATSDAGRKLALAARAAGMSEEELTRALLVQALEEQE
jgi:hypothetical protein